ncbi:hypothetical protein [Saccharothrix deserti]|uniref:hypothetical protein n=1 Tax=Saccharothrix deserti TaxID=2593674 RepID=UPI00131BCD44|nr:hypothetical protein [Saccharothrix deserti]
MDARGVAPDARDTVLSFTGGNPLALALAAAVALRGDTSGWTPGHHVIGTLVPKLVGDTPSPRHRRALEICAHAHITSESMLRALMGDDAPELFAWLRAQPFVESAPSGVFPHDAVREVLEADLKWRDPDGFAEMHRNMLEHLLDQLRSAPGNLLVPATGALIYLYRTDRRISEFNNWREAGLVEDQPYAPAHRQRVLDLVDEAEGAESAFIAEFWLDRQPEAFRVYRSTETGGIVAFSTWLRLFDPEGVEVDPVVAAAWEHARATGAPKPGEHLALARFSVYPPAHQRPSASMTLTQWRATGEMIVADRLTWSYVVMRDDGFWDAHLGDINMVPIEDRPVVGGHRHALFGHDWRAQPVVPWLREKSNVMLSGSPAGLGPAAGQDGVVAMSRPEFDVAVRDALRALQSPQGAGGQPAHPQPVGGGERPEPGRRAGGRRRPAPEGQGRAQTPPRRDRHLLQRLPHPGGRGTQPRHPVQHLPPTPGVGGGPHERSLVAPRAERHRTARRRLSPGQIRPQRTA